MNKEITVLSMLREPGIWVGCFGLAFCFIARDMPQFLGFSVISGNVLSQYGLAGARAIPLATLLVWILVTKRRHSDYAFGERTFLLLGINGAVAQIVGLLLITLPEMAAFTLIGCWLLGLGQSLLLLAWSFWLLRRTPFEFLTLLGVGFLLAGLLEAALALMHAVPTLVLSLGAPLASAFCSCITAKQGSLPSQKTYHRSSRMVLDKRFVLYLIMLVAYSFIARQLADAWMIHGDDVNLGVFEFFGGLGTAAASFLAWATLRMGRLRRNNGVYLLLAFPLVMGAAYMSSTLGSVFSSLYLLPLFAIRKSILLFALLCAINYASERDRLLAFTAAMLCVEIGNLAQTACSHIFSVVALPTEIVSDVAFTIVLILMCVLPLSILLTKSGFTECSDMIDASGETRLRKLREQSLDELASEYGLTPREREVLTYLDAGRNAEYIAKTLYIAHSTAKSHIAHIYQKMDMNSQQRLMDAVEERMRVIDQREVDVSDGGKR